MNYFSQLLKSKLEPDTKLGNDFFVAFKAYIEALAEKHWYFTQSFPWFCGAKKPALYDQVGLRYKLQQEVGAVDWPITGGSFQSNNAKILDVVQFFYKYVAKPLGMTWCGPRGCSMNHPQSYDQQTAKHEYLQAVNQMFRSFNHPYELMPDGKIELRSSVVLDDWIGSFDFKTDDKILLDLMKSALENFYDKTGTKKLEGLKSIVSAFHRLKTIEDNDKRKSVEKVIQTISSDVKIQTMYNDLFNTLTNISHETIRHSEMGKSVLSPEHVAAIEYLFYTYYAVVRLVLTRYGLWVPKIENK